MKKGMTLVEALVAVIILAITVAGGMQLYTLNLKTSMEQDQYYYAENLLRQCVEEIRNDPTKLDNTASWMDAASPKNGKLKNTTVFAYKGLQGGVVNYNIELDTAIIKSDSGTPATTGTPLARLKQIKATAKWGTGKTLTMTTVVEYTYPRPAVGL